MGESPAIRRALISVSDKTGLAELAQCLASRGVEIYSTGGTRAFLEKQGLQVVDIGQFTGFPEIMGGRVKTLHPKIFGGILGRRALLEDQQAMEQHGLLPFDLVVVNLYPFRETIAKDGVTWEEAVEQIDIGGPSLIRAASKNHPYVTVATSPSQYSAIQQEIESTGKTSLALRKRMAAECFASTAAYDACIANYFAQELAKESKGEEASASNVFPAVVELKLARSAELRYGENPHQAAAVYSIPESRSVSIVGARQLNGKELSYNNLLDLDSAMNIARSFQPPAAVVIKHNNPCGAATSHKLVWACRKALAGDPLSAFGGVIGFNRVVEADTAEVLCEPGLFVEAIVAPEFSPEALALLKTKPKWRDNVRLLAVGQMASDVREWNYRFLSGGVLIQESDTLHPNSADWKTVTEVGLAGEFMDDVQFAWEMVRHVKSNAIVLAKDAALVGVGAGQMSRVDSVEISIHKAGERSRGSILASDAFFPFPDSIDRAAAAGVIAIIQPGGSKKDDEVIAACNKHRIPMIFTGRRHFKH